MSDYIEMAQGKLGRVIVVRLRPGADVLLSLEEACREHNITNGVILSAIGSLQSPQFCDVVEMPIKAGYGYGETLHLALGQSGVLFPSMVFVPFSSSSTKISVPVVAGVVPG